VGRAGGGAVTLVSGGAVAAESLVCAVSAVQPARPSTISITLVMSMIERGIGIFLLM
jgi:hypothetical protein